MKRWPAARWSARTVLRLAEASGSATAARIAASLFLLFHLFALMLAPNSQTYLASRAAFVVLPYVSFLELASQWGFFAPDPGPPPVYIEYELVGEDGARLGAGSWPEKTDPFFVRERQNRRIAVARFLIGSNERTEKMMGPYFCRANPDARSVRLWRTIGSIPSLQDVAKGARHPGDGADTQRKWVGQYLCPRGRA